jgi:hypothetical protein
MVSVPVLVPALVGAKVTLIVQLPLAGIPEPQVLLWANGAVVEIDVMLRLTSVLRVTDCVALVEPKGWEPKVRLWGDKVTTGAMPVPERATVWGLPGPLSVITTDPLFVPAAVGVKVTLMVQLELTARVAGERGQALV